MHITILALGSRGDVLPYIALGNGLIKAGHRVRMITFTSFAPLVAQHGLDFHPIQGDAQALVARAGADMLRLARSFGALAESYARDLSAPVLGETNLIVNQLPGGMYGYDLAEKWGVPMMLAAVIPLARTRFFPLMGFPRLPLPGYNQLTYRIGEQMAWQMMRGAINRWRLRVLELAPLPAGGFFDQPGTRRIPILNGFSRHVVQPPPDWGEHIHLTGYWFPDDLQWQPQSDLLAFLAAGSPPVFIGFGSMPVKDPLRATRTVLAALEATGQRAILHAGWDGLSQQHLPASVFPIDYAPYDWLFPRMTMLVHHGGSGTTAAGLRAGVPACVVPFVFDQFYWGKRIAELGVGPRPIPFARLTAERLSAAIHQGVSNGQMHQQSAALAQQIQAENGIARAVELIENFA